MIKSEVATNQSNDVPTILVSFLQPGFPTAKVFTCFFLDDCMVLVRTGSFGTNMAGTMHASLGGYTSTGLIAGAIGRIVDMFNEHGRTKKTSEFTDYSPENLVSAHRGNFIIPYYQIKSVVIKGPNFAGEVGIIIFSDKTHKFRIDRQSKESVKYTEQVFNKFLPGKILKK